MAADAFRRGDELCRRIPSFRQPMLVLAHHDDEISTAGLLQRLGPRTRVVFVTNSDGLYAESGQTPAEAAGVRTAEGFASLGLLGIPPEGVTNLAFSEVETYRRLAWLHAGDRTVAQVRPWFQGMRDAVRGAIFAARPDVVFTQAWQGGQPEHDLAHFFTVLAVRDLERETGEAVPLYHLPAYEYTVLIAMRFHPLYRGPRLRLRLTPAELALKLRQMDAHASQRQGFERFRRALGVALRLAWPFVDARTPEGHLSVEELGPVPPDLDYTRPPHRLDALTYMFDHFEGARVSFRGSIRPIVRAFLATGPAP
jgi:LmbE family N-acetylglucosaminyl deacetylase